MIGRGEDDQQGRDDEQLDEGEPAPARVHVRTSHVRTSHVSTSHVARSFHLTVTVTGLNWSWKRPPVRSAWRRRSPGSSSSRADRVEEQRGDEPGARRADLVAGARHRDIDPAGHGVDLRRERRGRAPWRMNVPSCTSCDTQHRRVVRDRQRQRRHARRVVDRERRRDTARRRPGTRSPPA